MKVHKRRCHSDFSISLYNKIVKSSKNKHKYIIGIDEVGRGPIAGPVTVGAVLLPRCFNWKNFKGLKDSKKLSPKNREAWFSKVIESDRIKYSVSSVGHKIIDSKGISYAIRTAVKNSINSFDVDPLECLVLLDGGLRAPDKFIFQKTIIRGDEKEFSIALASILAKVTRDRKMISFAKKYFKYGFDIHKGYGTKKHYEFIRKYGVCDIHRKSYIKS